MKKKKVSEGEKVKADKGKENKGLQAALDEIREKFGEGAIMTLKDVKAVDVDVIPTGCISLDMALGVGGIPRGRVIEIYGGESAGKTTLSLHILAEAQKRAVPPRLLMPSTRWTLNTPSASAWMSTAC
jgi:RecA/RadA recombinase